MNMKKLLIFGGLGLVIIGGAGAGAFLFLKGGGHEETEAESEPEHEAEEKSAHTPPKKAPSHPAPAAHDDDDDYPDAEEEQVLAAVNQTHIVNLPGSSRGGFLRCQISIQLRDAELGARMNSDQSPEFMVAKAIVLETLSMLTSEEVLEPETKHTLVEDLKDKLNDKLRPRGPAPVQDKHNTAPPRPKRPVMGVLITEWAVQR